MQTVISVDLNVIGLKLFVCVSLYLLDQMILSNYHKGAMSHGHFVR